MAEVQRYSPGDYVKEKNGSAAGEVKKTEDRPNGKQYVTFELSSGASVSQFADFLEPADRPSKEG